MIPTLHPTTHPVELAPGDTLWWSPRTGRGARLSPAAFAAAPGAGRCTGPSAAVAQATALGLVGEVDEPRMRPVRSAWPVVAAGSIWAPDPLHPTPGGLPWRVIGTFGWQLALWERLGTKATLAEALAPLPVEVLPEAARWIARLRTAEVQALQLWPVSARIPEQARVHLWSPPRPPHPRGGVARFDSEGATALGEFHRGIDDAATHFDDGETTLAWAFGVPHPALGGRTWGRALHDALAGRGLVRGRVVEVGAGSGEVARDFPHRPYLRVDLSPALLAQQARVAPDTEGVEGDAVALPLPDESVDLLVSNEVIADLAAAPAESVAARAWRARAGLAERDGWVNTGAFDFLAEIARVLRPGGAAWLSEFGGDEPPEETVQLDHPEVSIHFGEVERVARSLGLSVERAPVASFLGLDLSARWLWRPHWQAVRAIARAQGVHLSARACPEIPFAVEGLRYVPLTDEGPGPLPGRFEGVVVRKGASA